MYGTSPLAALRGAVIPLHESASDYDPLFDWIGDAQLVLLGEASHGTHEFYKERARITKRLIREKSFQAVAVEADWPAAHRAHRYVGGGTEDADATEALAGFLRFPTWMWRNADVLDFVGWLRAHNDGLEPGAPRVGFYGLDLYSMYASIEAVLTFLDRVDPEAARGARARYACFDHIGEDSENYALATAFGRAEPCAREATQQLLEMQRRVMEWARADGDGDEIFDVEQNARLVKNAEAYYRSMFKGRVKSWNLRDHHMVETLEAIIRQLSKKVAVPKIAIWAHNSHLGDARATAFADVGELNVGQLVRERYGHGAFLVGFTTHEGTVTAARAWDGPAERRQVRPSLPGSWERLFHDVGVPRWLLPTTCPKLELEEGEGRLERAIGVVYRPESERLSHYYNAWMGDQFDALIHVDRTRAVEPLERTHQWHAGEAPETYPFAV
jgi:erythromycin esterase-like protein